MNNKEVAHLWANQSRAGASGSHFYFNGETIYSYGSHFPIARHFKGIVLFTTQGHSVSTSRHKGYVRSACSHLTVFEVSDPTCDPSGSDVKDYVATIKQLALNAGTARNPDGALTVLESAVNEANSFCERFGFKTRFSMPDNLDELREKANVSAERERKAKAAKQARLESDAQATIAQWLAGESVAVPYLIGTVYLRARHAACESINGNEPDGFIMETSKGARVALSEAEKAFRFAVAVKTRGWKRNGETFKIGDYQLDAVNEQGVVAGCHRVAWDEIERFATAQGWI